MADELKSAIEALLQQQEMLTSKDPVQIKGAKEEEKRDANRRALYSRAIHSVATNLGVDEKQLQAAIADTNGDLHQYHSQTDAMGALAQRMRVNPAILYTELSKAGFSTDTKMVGVAPPGARVAWGEVANQETITFHPDPAALYAGVDRKAIEAGTRAAELEKERNKPVIMDSIASPNSISPEILKALDNFDKLPFAPHQVDESPIGHIIRDDSPPVSKAPKR